MTLQGKNSKSYYQKALRFIPYGVNSNFRYWGEDDTLVIERGQGSHIWDVDGKEYIDYRLAFGPIILGHGYQRVVKAVQDAIEKGTLFAWTTPTEIEVAQRIAAMCKVEKVRLTNTGSEATMHALRIARGYTGREKFIKFEGQYHGQNDYFMYSTAGASKGALGARRSPIDAVSTSGIPKAINQYVINLPFNDLERLEETVEAKWGDIAAIFVEPVMGNAAGIMPQPAFLTKIRALCDRYGIVLVFDEVKTGFRIAKGGAQEYFNIEADLVTYAKALGNGFPIAAFGGKAAVMDTIEPGCLAHGGTYSGNVVGTAAAEATLGILADEPVIETINTRGRALMDGIDGILEEAGIPHALTGVPGMFGILLGSDQKPEEFRDYLDGDEELYSAIAMELIQRGVQPDVDGREPWFLCYTHSEEDIAETLQIFRESVKAVVQ